MKIKVDNIEFVSFSSGICKIYSEDEEGNKIVKYDRIAFEKKVLGAGRYFTAAAAQVKIDTVIKIPLLKNINSNDYVEILGLGRFTIELVQEKLDTNPASLDLTLRQLEMFEVKNE